MARASLMASSLRRRNSLQGEDIEPMASVANVVDVMLVIAVALMMAIITHYNVDVSGDSDGTGSAADFEELDAVLEETDVPLDAAGGYEELGTVYVDPETDELYVVRSASSSASEGGSGNE